MNDQKHDPRPDLPTTTARYGGLEGAEAQQEGPELFPGEKALARTKAGSREEMRVLRRHYNWVNMVIALLACFALVAAALMLAPQPSGDLSRDVDHVAIAETAQGSAPFVLAVPDLPQGWQANAASLREDGTPPAETWYIAAVDAETDEWMDLRQVAADEVPEAWAELQLEDFAVTGESDLDGVTFERYAATSGSDIALLGDVEGTRLLLKGSGEWSSLEALATGAVASVVERTADGAAAEPAATEG